MPICPEGHQSTESDYCSVCGTPIGSGTLAGMPGGTSAEVPAPAGLEATSQGAPSVQTCPVCGSRAGADAFFCETCGYDYLTGSLPRSAQQEAEPEADVEEVESLPVSEPTPVRPDEVAEAEVVEEPATEESAGDEPVAQEPPVEAEVVSEQTVAEPSIDGPTEAPAVVPDLGAHAEVDVVEAEVVESPQLPEPPALGEDPTAEDPVAAEVPAEQPTTEEPAQPAEFEPIPSQAPARARQIPEPQPEPVASEPEQPQGSYLDLDPAEVSHEVDNPLVVESHQPLAEANPRPASTHDALSLGDAGGDVPRPDDLKPLAVPGSGPPGGQSPQPRPVNQPGPGRLQPPQPGPRPYAQPTPGGYRPAQPQRPAPTPLGGPPRPQQQRPAPAPMGGPPRPQARPRPVADDEVQSTIDIPVRRPVPEAPPVLPTRDGTTKWVAEIWIDPEWYRVQQPPEQLPSPGQPIIRGLRKTTIVIGRSSSGAVPDIDCITDTGVSRRQAALTTDGIRWFIEDLGSSNGTYVGQVDQPMPTQPIQGRVELGHHDRIYVGSWTRIVVRPALTQESGY